MCGVADTRRPHLFIKGGNSLEQFYDKEWDRYIFPTINDVFEHQNEIFMLLEKDFRYGLHTNAEGKWVIQQMSVINFK